MINYITDILNAALKKIGLESKIILEKPKEEKFGDLSTNLALSLAKELKKNPRDIANEIIDNLEYDKNLIEKIEVAGAGFINFYISDNFFKDNLKIILNKKSEYGKSDLYKDKTANIEWVSANPTGPLHAGHGRHICLGKAIANLLEWVGYKVTREYYYNDAGLQMLTLGNSVCLRYHQKIEKQKGESFPTRDDIYKGKYINTIANRIYLEYGETLSNKSSTDDFWKNKGEQFCWDLIISTLHRLKINHDIHFNESNLYPHQIGGEITVDNLDNYPDSPIIELLKIFREKKLIYKKRCMVA